MTREFIDHERIAQLTLKGLKSAEIAEMLDCSKERVRYSRRKTGVHAKASGPSSPYDDKLIAQLTLSGSTASQISKMLGCSKRCVQRSRVRSGVAKPPGRRLTPEEIQLAEKLFDDGCSRQEVERTLGRAPGSLSRRFPDRHWTHQQVCEFGALARKAKAILR